MLSLISRVLKRWRSQQKHSSARHDEYKPVPSVQLSIDMKVGAALFVSAIVVVCVVNVANGEPHKQDSGSGASVQVGDYILSIARAAAACDYVINTVCTINLGAYDACLNFGGGGLFCNGTCVNRKPCCKRCPV
ncbi:hypothetical protein AAVH_28697 [Aphelenchoides avenae]|nr:hypothetical protein AAVH_28697 [Aphelenchus avenae]